MVQKLIIVVKNKLRGVGVEEGKESGGNLVGQLST